MIDLHYWPTPNGHKITMMLEECGFDYEVHPVNIGKGEQFAPDFLKIAPNNRMPAIIDHDPGDGQGPLSVFESGAILLYLSKKAKRFGGETLRERVAVKEWLFWQVGGLGPMAGQAGHFIRFAPEKIAYGIKRYSDETRRLFEVLDRRLALGAFMAGDAYSVADMATYPWVVGIGAVVPSDGLDHVARWLDAIRTRPATIAAYAKGAATASSAAPAPPADPTKTQA